MSLLAERVNTSSGLADLPLFTDELVCGAATAPVLTTPAAVVATVVALAYAAGFAAGYNAGNHPAPQPPSN